MSLSEMFIRIMGIILAIVGFCLLLSAVGIDLLGIRMPNIFEALILGTLFLCAGIVVIRGGNFTL